MLLTSWIMAINIILGLAKSDINSSSLYSDQDIPASTDSSSRFRSHGKRYIGLKSKFSGLSLSNNIDVLRLRLMALMNLQDEIDNFLEVKG